MKSSIEIGDYFIRKSLKGFKKYLCNPMKLQKLVYFSYGWFLYLYDKPLTTDVVHAAQYGPVFYKLYHETKNSGNNLIKKRIINNNVFYYSLESALLDKVWDTYKKLDCIQLANMTHDYGTPWMKLYQDQIEKNGYMREGLVISDESIKEYFKQKTV